MAGNSGKSDFFRKYGDSLRRAHEAHKDDATEYSRFSDLPPGIKNGVAKLVEAKFDQYKTGKLQGEYYFFAAAVVLSPASVTHNNRVIDIEGLRTQIGPEPMCDSTNSKGQVKTTDEHIAWLYNELRKLGIDTSNLQFEDLEATVEALTAKDEYGELINPIYIKFDTRAGKATPDYPNPKTFHEWNGTTDPPPEGEDAVEDDTGDEPPVPTPPALRQPAKAAGATGTAKPPAGKGAAPSTPQSSANASRSPAPPPVTRPPALKGGEAKAGTPSSGKTPSQPPSQPAKPAAKPAPAPTPRTGPGKPASKPPAQPPKPFTEFSMDELVSAAEKENEGAQTHLTDMAKELGLTDDEIGNADTWAKLVEMIEAKQQEGEGESGEETAEGEPEESAHEGNGFTPEVGEVYLYHPFDLRTKAKAKIPNDCKVLAVNTKNRTVQLQNLAQRNRTHTDVPWDELNPTSS